MFRPGEVWRDVDGNPINWWHHDLTGWAPNEARSAVAPTPNGPWKELGNPCLGKGAELTYGAQSTFVLPVPGRPDAFIFMADQWRPGNLADSRYVWLPMFFKRTVAMYPPRPFVRWREAWDLSEFEAQGKGVSS
jgi:hypothetical protein